jgi:outer membrane receptor for monomeric catechols
MIGNWPTAGKIRFAILCRNVLCDLLLFSALGQFDLVKSKSKLLTSADQMNDQPSRQTRPIRQLATLLLSQGVAAVAQSQSTNTPAASGVATNTASQLPEVVVTGQAGSYKSDAVELPKITQPLRDTPQSITVIPRELMDDQNATTLRDALRNVSGISIAAGEGTLQGDNLTIRGFSAQDDIFLDGMRDIGSYYRDPFNYQSVDVLEGPESVMFGRGSTGGVVNQESKTPVLAPFVAGTLSLGTDVTRRGTVDVLGGDQRVDGIELALAGHLTKEWQVLAGYDYLDSEVVSSKDYPLSVGQPLSNVPKNSVNLWTTYDLPWRFEIGAGVNYISSRFANSATLTSTTPIEEAPGYYVVNALIKYKASKRITCQVNINNLTDRFYYAQVFTGHVVPGAGISALFSTSFKF